MKSLPTLFIAVALLFSYACVANPEESNSTEDGHPEGTIFKIVNDDGSISYTNTPPKSISESKVEALKPKKVNTIGLRDTEEEFGDSRLKRNKIEDNETKKKREARQQARKRRVQQLQQALQAAKQLKPGDYFINANGAVVTTPQYQQRVQAAQDRLNNVTKGR